MVIAGFRYISVHLAIVVHQKTAKSQHYQSAGHLAWVDHITNEKGISNPPKVAYSTAVSYATMSPGGELKHYPFSAHTCPSHGAAFIPSSL